MPTARKVVELLLILGLISGMSGRCRGQATSPTPRSGPLPEALPPLPDERSPASSGPAGGTGTSSDPTAGAGASNGSASGAATDPAAPPGGAGPNSPASDPSPGPGGPNTTAAAVNAPTQAEAAGAGPPQTNYLARFLGIQDSPVKVYGWLQNSYTGNTNGRPKNGNNFSVFPNRRADQWQGNQYYLILEKVLAQKRLGQLRLSVRHPFRQRLGVHQELRFVRSSLQARLVRRRRPPADLRRGPSADPDQKRLRYPRGSVLLTRRFRECPGGQSDRFLSVPYLFNFTPFTLFGFLTTLHVNERFNIYNGAVNGWDRWIDQNYRYSYPRRLQLQLARRQNIGHHHRPDRPRPAPSVRPGETRRFCPPASLPAPRFKARSTLTMPGTGEPTSRRSSPTPGATS